MLIGSRQHTEFLIDFNCELNKKSMTGCANWVMRLPHRLSVTVGVISSICNAYDQ